MRSHSLRLILLTVFCLLAAGGARAQQPSGQPETAPTTGAAAAPASQPAAAQDPNTITVPVPAPTPKPSTPATPDPWAPPPGGGLKNYPFHGMIGVNYLYRTVETGFQDNDVFGYISLDAGEPGSSRISGHLFARVSYDVDGNEDSGNFEYFRDIVDTYDSQFNARLYSAYIDFNRLGPIKLIRLGRMEMWDAPVFFYFDGARVETMEARQLLNFKIGAYGGVPVRHLYESSTSGSDEWLYGAYAQTRPWEGARAQVHFAHLTDNNYYGSLSEDYLAVSLRQSIKDVFVAEANYSRVGNTDRDLRGRILFFIPQTETQVQLSYYELLEAQVQRVLELDYYYWVMQTYLPYRQGNVLVYQGLGKYFAVQGGYDVRQLSEDQAGEQEIAWNHEFQRYFATLIVRPGAGFIISGTGENWKTTDDNSMNLTTAAGDVTWQLDGKFRISGGTYYSLYQYSLILEDEEEQVQTYYVRLRWSPVKPVRLDLGYQYEETQYEDFQTVRVGLNYIF